MLKILIADDEKYERDSIVNLIEENFKEKLTIAQAKNGREAIEIAEQIRPEIVIMDIKMPGINGIKAIEEIKKTAVNTYFIMLTAYDYFDFAVEAVKLNVKEYLLKPFIRMELIKKN
ncbi:response regulator [Clostridium tertium]|uniref:response regulator n=1 Tax=Clostridium tertium TaxID=1559 RepID=UPI0024B3ABFB|nr:response regulator [Clostridium tertium]MDI9218495.1 response regulator [Clostridium tertium]